MENTEKKVIEYTPAQEAAMNSRGRTLLVSAAAGSGKTFTLTQRIIKEIIEEDRDISRMLIVTFTRAAAGDLRAKISKAIQDAIDEHPDKSEKLQAQMIKLSSAHISTIDSFFTAPVRANFEKLGLPASIRLADEAELSPLREEVMRQTIEEYFERKDLFRDGGLSDVLSQSNYTDLLTVISTARDGSVIVPIFIDIYKKLMTSPIGIEQLKRHACRMASNASKDFFDTDEGKIIRNDLISIVNYTKKSFEQCCAEFEQYPFVKEKYLGCFIKDAEICAVLLAALDNCSYIAAKTAFEAFKSPKIPSISKQDKTPDSIYYQELRKKLNESLRKRFKELISDTPEQISEYFKETSELCLVIYEILKEFDRVYSAEKLQKGICEFSDMPKYMLKLLTNPDGSPSQYCLTLRDSFDEVYIDEYQDVNEIQDTIFSLIGTDRRFMVGDIKQSIYGFREAEPSIFAGYRNTYKKYDEKDPESMAATENTIFMSSNFRCDENVIKFSNDVCSKVFSSFADSIGYTSDDDLVFAKLGLPKGYVCPRVKINIVHKEDAEETDENELDEIIEEQEDIKNNQKEISEAKALSDEACVVANEIAELLRHGKKPDGSPMKGKDIAILVRSHKSARPLMLALDRMNIKYTASAGKSPFSDQKMILLVDLLTVIDNPRSDIPLYRLLCSEEGDVKAVFSMEEIITVRRSTSSSRSLFDALKNYAERDERDALTEKCAEIINELNKLRREAAKLSADKLLRILTSVERYSALTDSEAFVILYDKACQYVRRSWNGLGSFLTYVKKLSETGDSLAESSRSEGNEVNIISMHQSKGLEFPACFLFATGKQINSQDSKNPMIYTKELGISIKLPAKKSADDPLNSIRVRYSSNPLWRAADILTKRKQAEEEARILYVALTRARESLYISASTRKSFKQELEAARRCADLDYSIRNAKRYLDWFFLTLADKEWNNDVFYCELTEKGSAEFTSPISRQEIAGNAEYSEYDRELARLFLKGCEGDNKERTLATIPAKVAASKVSSTMLDDSVFLPIPLGNIFEDEDEDINEQKRESVDSVKKRIELMRAQKDSLDDILAINQKPTAAEKGTATHLFLQYCDYAFVDSHGIDAEIKRLLSSRFISKRTASAINKKQLQGFFESELYAYISSAAKVRREFKFGMFRPASEFTKEEGLKELVRDKKIFVQGSIDLIIETPDGEILLCDYKTDRISKEERADRDKLIANMKKRHSNQLEQYRYAVEQIFGKSPAKMFIYSTPLGEAIEIK